MNNQKIKTLLDRYFEGETTLEEERMLTNYFQNEEVEERLRVYLPLFQMLELEKEKVLPDEFEVDFDRALQAHIQQKSGSLRISFRRWYVRAAAVLVLTLGLAWMWSSQPVSTETAAVDWSKYEPDNPEEALELYKKAMLKLGKSLNQGTAAAAGQVQKFDEVAQFFE